MNKLKYLQFLRRKYDIIKDNYTPILTALSKLCETVIADQLIEYFKSIFSKTLCA